MDRIETYDKNTLLVYLINELSDKTNFKVTTALNKDGCWTGRVIIEETNEPAADIEKYYMTIAENTKKCMQKDI